MTTLDKKAILGIISVTILVFFELVFIYRHRVLNSSTLISSLKLQTIPSSRVTLLAFGDINLGRKVGEKLVKGEIDFPFKRFNVRLDSADIVFANLESQLSDQNGVTEDPKNNIVFTGPPQGAASLASAGISVVSTANNHALDYGVKALHETIDNLKRENILHVGTSKDKKVLFEPIIIEKNNIKFAIFAVTSFINFTPSGWRDVVASADTTKLLPIIQKYRASVDVIILSYHGGGEYNDKPIAKVKNMAEWCVKNGVDLFIGHHPHVTYGIEKKGEKIVVHSLGNFVFYQPQHYWTQRSYGVKFWFEKVNSKIAFDIEKVIPLKVDIQTERMVDSTESKKLFSRTQKLSNIDVSSYWK